MTRIWNKHKQTNTPLKRKVFVAMSGGVDSSVSAALLKKEGYDTTGVFMVNWKEGCDWKEDRRDAMQVCAKLGIPFLTFDFEKEYKKEVIDYMTREYIEGRTPNPDVMCNKKIKFGIFLKHALKMGADYVATGHYIRISRMRNSDEFPISNSEYSGQFSNKSQILNPKQIQNSHPLGDHPKGEKQENYIYKLLQAKDKNKDQSYFLWTLAQEQLKHCLFPIGDYLKPNIRKMAAKFNLPTAQKKDSQGLCFVGKVKFDDFLKNLIAKKNVSKNHFKKGKIIGTNGNLLGEHIGLPFYTIGQRQGLKIGGRQSEKTQESKPLYVVEKNLSQNTLIVAEEKNPLLYKKELFAKKLNWINGFNPIGSTYGVKARIRYRGPLQKCTLAYTNDTRTYTENYSANIRVKSALARVVFDKPQRAVAPGQSIVFYKGEEMLGGGIIC